MMRKIYKRIIHLSVWLAVFAVYFWIGGERASANVITFAEYQEQYARETFAGERIVVDAADYIYADAEANVTTVSDYMGMPGETLITGEEGSVEWRFNVPKDGLYSIEALYYPAAGRGNAIERLLSIDGALPYQEAMYILLPRIWANSEPIRQDGRGNDIRPRQEERPAWRTNQFYDSLGYYNEPLWFYLSQGEHTIRLTASREPLALRSLTLGYNEKVLSYAEMKQIYAQNGYQPVTGNEMLKIQAQDADTRSEFTIYPENDRSSAITEPQDSSKVRLNSLNGTKWKLPHQWVTWKVYVPETGLYKLALRYKQNIAKGRYSNRRLTIDGQAPFKEAESLKFKYSTNWQVLVPGDEASGEDYLFYLTAGEHEIALDIILGDMAEIVADVSDALAQLNKIYRNILMITGPEPDLYRDYFFNRLIAPDIANMETQWHILSEISKRIETISGGKGEDTVIIDKLLFQLESMYKDHNDIAKYFKSFRDNIAAFAAWNLGLPEQPLTLDYFAFMPPDMKTPRAEGSFFTTLLFDIMSFFRTFFEDYNALGSSMTEEEMKSSDTLEVWLNTGRDQMQIMRGMVNDSFTPETNINVTLKLVEKETLLPSVLAGVGPDVSLSNDVGLPVQYAIRNAALPLNGYGNYAEVIARFHPSALTPFIYEDTVYGLPETQLFPMLFYRKDILDQLGLKPPETWDEFYKLISELQKVNMQTGFPKDLTGLQIFLYQEGGQLYNDRRTRTTLDADLTVDCFQRVVELFTAYKLPRDIDFPSRFRTGEVPVGIYNYDFYNQMIAFAPEIRGQWEFMRLPGTVMPDGSVRHTTPTSGMAVMMLSGAGNPQNAWRFMDWYTDAPAQARFGQEMQAVLGPSAKQATANMEALAGMPWTQAEYSRLMQQWADIQGTPEVPGGYAMTRAVDFAAAAAYNNGDPEAILNEVKAANREVLRKREEFGLPLD